MIAVISRVSSARLSVDGVLHAAVEKGLLIYLCVEKGDTVPDAEKLAHKCAGLRIFEDEAGKMNRDAHSAGASFLVVSNFTLAGALGSGFRPSFTSSESPDAARAMVERFASLIAGEGHEVRQGVFGADMQIENTADGPVTLILRARGGKLIDQTDPL